MTKSEYDECYGVGMSLSIICIYFNDENKSFFHIVKSLNRNEKNSLLREIIYWRIAIVYNKIDELLNIDENDQEIFESVIDFQVSILIV